MGAGFHGPAWACLLVGAVAWRSAGVECLEAFPAGGEVVGPPPAGWDEQGSAAGVDDVSGWGAEEPVAQRFPIGPVVTMSAGGAVLIAALTTGLLTNAREDELVRNCNSEQVCESKLAEVKDGGKDLKLVTNVLLATGGAAITAGIVWWLLSDGEPEQQRVQAGLGCTHDGCLGDVKVGF